MEKMNEEGNYSNGVNMGCNTCRIDYDDDSNNQKNQKRLYQFGTSYEYLRSMTLFEDCRFANILALLQHYQQDVHVVSELRRIESLYQLKLVYPVNGIVCRFHLGMRSCILNK